MRAHCSLRLLGFACMRISMRIQDPQAISSYVCTCKALTGCMRLLSRAPPSLWAPWQPDIYSAGAYVLHRRAMQQLLGTYLPGLTAPVQDMSFSGSHAHVALLCMNAVVWCWASNAWMHRCCRIGKHSGGQPDEPGHQLAAPAGLPIRAHPLLCCKSSASRFKAGPLRS